MSTIKAYQKSQSNLRTQSPSSDIQRVKQLSSDYVRKSVFEAFRSEVSRLITTEMSENTSTLEQAINSAIEEARDSLLNEIDQAIKQADSAISNRMKVITLEVDNMIESLDKIRTEKNPVIPDNWLKQLKSLVVQRSLSIPVASDEGGTGSSIRPQVGQIPVGQSNGAYAPGYGTVSGNATVSSATTLTLSSAGLYVFTGTSATWTLPLISSINKLIYYVKNRSNGSVTIVPSGTDQLYTNGFDTSLVLQTGDAYTIANDGSYWEIM